MPFQRSLRLPPLPGTQRAPRGLFVGRWGALLERSDNPCRGFDDALLAEKAGELLFRATQAGWRLYLVGNEPDVAKGRVSDAAWEAFQQALHAHLTGQGIGVARDYACLDHPQQGKGKHKRESVFRFPNTGALYHAVQEDGIELATSWMVSDDVLELAAASRAGLHTVALAEGPRLSQGPIEVEAERRSPSFADAIATILSSDALRRG